MIKWIVILMLIPNFALAEKFRINPKTCSKIPEGAICYDKKEEFEIDEALELGVECQKNLEACRKWRDKYKSLLNRDSLSSQDANILDCQQTTLSASWYSSHWFQAALIATIGLGLGVVIGSTF